MKRDELLSSEVIARDVIERLADLAETIAAHAGVGGMETAGGIVSYLAEHPDDIPKLMDGTLSILDWPDRFHTHGRLSWHGANGGVFTPEYARRHDVIRGIAAQGGE